MSELERALWAEVHERHGADASIAALELIPGGASQEAWKLDVDTGGERLELIVRRDLGGRMFATALSRALEFRVIEAAYDAGVPAPRPFYCVDDLAGRPAFVMQRLTGETIGRRIVRNDEFAAARPRLPEQMGQALAAIHATSVSALRDLPQPADGERSARYVLRVLEEEMADIEEPYPALSLALQWLHEHAPADDLRVLVHGDYRIGNMVVNGQGLVGVLDWEFAHIGHPGEDIGFGITRAWRFGRPELRFGGVGHVEDFLAAYVTAGGARLSPADVYFWEVTANLKWAVATITQARRHLSGVEPSMELASLGRMTAEIELELLSLIDSAHPRYPY